MPPDDSQDSIARRLGAGDSIRLYTTPTSAKTKPVNVDTRPNEATSRSQSSTTEIIQTSFEKADVGAQAPKDPFFLFSNGGLHEVIDDESSDGTHAFLTAEASLGSPSAFAVELDLANYDTISLDVFTINNNPSNGNIKISLDGAGYGNSKTNIWDLPTSVLSERGYSNYRNVEQWYEDIVVDLTDYDGQRTVAFWVDGDNNVIWDNISFEPSDSTDVGISWSFDTRAYIASSKLKTGTILFDSDQFYALDAGEGTEEWSIDTNGFEWTVDDDTVYIGAEEEICAVDLNSGRYNWSYESVSEARTPILSDGVIFAGAHDGNVYAIDADDGSERWTFETDGTFCTARPSPEDLVYVAADDAAYALEKATGEIRWQHSIIDEGSVWVKLREGRVFASSSQGGIYALDPTDGTEQWFFDAGRTFVTKVTSDTVYIDVVTESGGRSNNSIVALDIDEGKSLWTFDAVDHWSTFAIEGGVLYVSSYDSRVYALDADTGDELWRFETGGLNHTPNFANNTLYVGSRDSHIYALDPETGNPHWQFETEDMVWDKPIFDDGTVYAGSWDNTYYALDDEIRGGGDGAESQFSVGIRDVAVPEPGGNVIADVLIENTGEASGTQTIVYESEGLGAGSFDVTVDAGLETTRVLNLETESDDAGEYTLSVSSDDETATETFVIQQPTPTQWNSTQLPASSTESRLRDANTLATVRIEGHDYYVLNEIPNQPPDQYAYTTTDYELLEPDGATDVALSHNFCSAYQLDSQDRLDYTKNQYEGFDNVEEMARTANILAQLSGAFAMMAMDPASGLPTVVELTSTAVDWAAQDSNQPYYEQFAKMAATTSTLEWADNEVADPGGSLLNTSEDTLNIMQTTLAAAETAQVGATVGKSAATVREVISQADSLRTDVNTSTIDGADDLRSSGYTLLAGLAVSATVSSVVNMAEPQAKAAAIGRANAAARRPLLNELISLEERASDYRMGPAGLLRMQALRQVDYQIEAAAWSGISEIYSGLSSGILGPAHDAFLGAGDFEELAENNATAWENLSHYTMVSTGEHIRRGLDKYEQSLNSSKFGDQTMLDRQ